MVSRPMPRRQKKKKNHLSLRAVDLLGPYGKGVGKWSLKAAREEWERIRTWSRETGQDPRELRKE